jgi:nicotinate-nucleotide pyrophosphorylase (carboxylating)
MDGLPHDRSHLLWEGDFENGLATPLFLKSMDGWINSMIYDEQGGGSGPENIITGKIICKEDGYFCGKHIVNRLAEIHFYECEIIWYVEEGERIKNGQLVLEMKGMAAEILKIERIMLNILGNLSGITTNTKKWVKRSKRIKIAATRKTDWGLMDKWAVHVGGGYTHRLNRNDAVMLKENDFAAYMRNEEDYLETICRIINEIDLYKVGDFITIEVQNMNEVMLVVETWAKKIQSESREVKIVLLLDNMDIETVKIISKKLIKNKLRGYCILEASGGINIDSLEDWNKTDIEVISSSKLNRGVNPIDLSMLFVKEKV